MAKLVKMLVVLAAVLTITASARAKSFDFYYSGYFPGSIPPDSSVSAWGTLVGTFLGYDSPYGTDAWLITSGTGFFDYSFGSGAISLIANPSSNPEGPPSSSPLGDLLYDDLLYLPSFNGGETLDLFGLLFNFDGLELRFDEYGAPTLDELLVSNGSDSDVALGRFIITPEPGPWLLVAIGLLGVAFLRFRKARQFDLNSNSRLILGIPNA